MSRSLLYRALLAFGILFLIASALWPIGAIVWQAIAPDGMELFAPLQKVFHGDDAARVLMLLWRTVLLGGTCALACVLVGVPIAYALACSDLPGKPLIRSLCIAPIVIAPLISAIAWSEYLDTFVGMSANVFVFTLSYTPIVIVLATRAFEQIDREREDATRLVGSEWTVFRMALASAWPQILIAALLVFVFVSADFAVPDYIVAIQSIETQPLSFNVYAAEIFAYTRNIIPNSSTPYAYSAAFALPLVAIILGALLVILRLIRRQDVRSESLPQPRRSVKLGRAKGFVLALAIAYAYLAVGVPIRQFIGKIQHPNPLLRALGLRADATVEQNLSEAFTQSVTLSLWAATLAVLATLAIAHAVARSRRGWSWSVLWILPLAFPGIAYGLGMVTVFSNGPRFLTDLRDTQVPMILNLAGRFLPFTFFAVLGATRRLDPSLEEAGLVCGQTPTRVFSRVSFPLIARGALAGWLLTFLFSMREIDSATLLSSGRSTIMHRIYGYVHIARTPELAAGCLVLILLVAIPLLVHALLSRREIEVL